MNPPTSPRPRALAFITFAKAPQPGQVKTRLAERLTEAEAAGLYEAFLKDALAQQAALAGRHGATLRLYHAGPDWPASLTPEGATLHRQRSGGLGERMAAAFRETIADGTSGALIMGTDHPTLPPAFVEQGIDVLREGNREAVCIGPTGDGGFYLLGMRCFRPVLFEGMTYSHAEVFSETLARAAASGNEPPVVLPAWYDVDRSADLCRLAAELLQDDDLENDGLENDGLENDGQESDGQESDGQESDAALPGAPYTRRRLRTLLDRYPALCPAATRAG